ncbi:hypothetical protein D6089_02110, partial [Vibrio vulnificus]|nr:hypothetical protein [Vibrio vulnificus]
AFDGSNPSPSTIFFVRIESQLNELAFYCIHRVVIAIIKATISEISSSKMANNTLSIYGHY